MDEFQRGFLATVSQCMFLEAPIAISYSMFFSI